MSSPCLCITLRAAARRLTAAYDAALAPAGITVAQFSLLRTVDRAGQVSLTELGRRCALDRSTVGRNVRVLQRAGLLKPGTIKDQREATVAVTEAGGAVLQRALPLWERIQRQVETDLGPPGAAQLSALLQAI